MRPEVIRHVPINHNERVLLSIFCTVLDIVPYPRDSYLAIYDMVRPTTEASRGLEDNSFKMKNVKVDFRNSLHLNKL
jgi:hypothetical protein